MADVLPRLLAELEHLDGATEAEVVRSALAAGMPEQRVIDELEREVARRRARETTRGPAYGAFYDW